MMSLAANVALAPPRRRYSRVTAEEVLGNGAAEFAVVALAESKAGNVRALQLDDSNNNNDDSTSDCSGAALTLVFTVTLEYRLRGGANATSLTASDIINEPFSTQAYRDD